MYVRIRELWTWIVFITKQNGKEMWKGKSMARDDQNRMKQLWFDDVAIESCSDHWVRFGWLHSNQLVPTRPHRAALVHQTILVTKLSGTFTHGPGRTNWPINSLSESNQGSMNELWKRVQPLVIDHLTNGDLTTSTRPFFPVPMATFNVRRRRNRSHWNLTILFMWWTTTTAAAAAADAKPVIMLTCSISGCHYWWSFINRKRLKTKHVKYSIRFI